jgi:PPE-repeat protein
MPAGASWRDREFSRQPTLKAPFKWTICGRDVSMIDFGALPPEVNSGRMYAGPGSGAMLAAASAWQATASQLDSVARDYGAVIAGLQGETWSGSASTTMAEAAQPYVEWMASAAAMAEETALQARAAAAAYESAYTATVPPPLVKANRTRYAALAAANVFGQYTTQIAAVEAEYAQMWAQDASAMYNYAASSSSAATTLTSLGEPPQTTNAAAVPAQAAAVAQAVGSSASPAAAEPGIGGVVVRRGDDDRRSVPCRQ